MSIITLFVIIATIMVFKEENQNYGKEINNQAYSAQFLLNADGKIEGTPQRLNQVSNPPVAKQVNIFRKVGDALLGGWKNRERPLRGLSVAEDYVIMQTDRIVWGVLNKYVDGAFNIRDLYLVNKDETVDQQIQRLIDEIELISDEYGKIPDMKIYVQERFVELKESMAKSKNKEIREHGEAEAVKQERLVLNDLEKVSQQMETRLSNLLAKFYEVTGKYYDIDHVFTDISDSWKNFIGDFIEKNKIEASRYIVNEYKYISPAILNEENYYYSYKLLCADKVFVETCTRGAENNLCRVKLTSADGKVHQYSSILEVPEKILSDNYVSSASCGTQVRYVGRGGAKYYKDPKLNIMSPQFTLRCGEKVDIHIAECGLTEYIPPGMVTTMDYRPFCKASYKNETIYIRQDHLTEFNSCANNQDPIERKTETRTETRTERRTDRTTQRPARESCRPSDPLHNQTSDKPTYLTICYDVNGRPLGPDEYSVFSCAAGYQRVMKEDYAHNTCKGTIDSEVSRVTYDENGRYFYGGGSRTSRGNSTCSKTFEYSCVPSKTSGANRPIASAGGGYVAGDGFGTINIEGIDSDTLSGLRGYLVWTNIAPTKHDSWRPLDNNNEATASVTTGMYFVSVITNDDVISYPTTVTIHDDDLSTTANISLRDTTGNQTYNVNSINGTREYGYKPLKNSQYTLLNNNLKKESVFANGFDLLTSAYEVTVEANKIAVYATLTSDDASYVDGYGPRTVSLNYGRNIILVKIKNNEGKERTYTFIVNRTDTRNNFNLITELTTSVGKLNFDRYVSDYRIEVPADTKTVDINAKIESLTGSFVKGYEPRTVELKEDITSAVLKTVSDADIVRSYLLTFVKKGSEVDDSIDASTYLSSLTIPGTEIKFDKDVTSYNVAVPYETENIEVFAYAESDNAVVDYVNRFTLQPGPNNLEITVKNGPEQKIYNVFINRKEDTIGVTSSTKLATLTIQDYDLKFNPDVKDYTVKIRNEKTLLLTATPESNRSEVYMYGNNDLTAYSTIRIKVIAEDGTEDMYSVDIVKALFNKDVERIAAIIIVFIIIVGGGAFIITKRIKHKKEYLAN